MTWILILNFLAINPSEGAVATAMHSVEFQGKEACMAAARLWIKTILPKPDSGIQVTAVCVPKGDK